MFIPLRIVMLYRTSSTLFSPVKHYKIDIYRNLRIKNHEILDVIGLHIIWDKSFLHSLVIHYALTYVILQMSLTEIKNVSSSYVPIELPGSFRF